MKKLYQLSDKRFSLVFFLLTCLIQLFGFISNWLIMINSGESPDAAKLFEISFFYFIPLVSWLVVIYLFVSKWAVFIARRNSISHFLKLSVMFITCAFLMRVFDILFDFTLKYILGMVVTSPFRILNDVWLVILASLPQTIIMLSLLGVLIYLRQQESGKLKQLKVLKGKATVNLALNEVIYIKANGNYLAVHDAHQEYQIRSTVNNMLQVLTDDFLQIHRSIIINKAYVSAIEHWRNGEYLISMKTGQNVASSRSFTAAVKSLKQTVPV